MALHEEQRCRTCDHTKSEHPQTSGGARCTHENCGCSSFYPGIITATSDQPLNPRSPKTKPKKK